MTDTYLHLSCEGAGKDLADLDDNSFSRSICWTFTTQTCIDALSSVPYPLPSFDTRSQVVLSCISDVKQPPHQHRRRARPCLVM